MSDATPNPRQIRVSFRKQLSDGSYGTEAAEVTLECFVHASISSQMDAPVAEDMLDEARQLVHRQLAASPSANVRRALGKVIPLQPEYDASPESLAKRIAGDEAPF